MNLLGSGDGALHSGGAVGEDQFRSVGLEKFPPFHAHGLRHGQNQPVPLDRGNQRKTDARIAGRRFDNQPSGPEQSPLFGVLDHRQRDAVLDAATGIEIFHFGEDLRPAVVETVDPDQRSPADPIRNAVSNFRHFAASLSYSTVPVVVCNITDAGSLVKPWLENKSLPDR